MNKEEERDLIAQLTGLVRSARMIGRGCYAVITVITEDGTSYTTHVHTPRITQADASRITSAVILAIEEEVKDTHLQPRTTNPSSN